MKTAQKKRVSGIAPISFSNFHTSPNQKQTFKTPIFSKGELLDLGHDVVSVVDILTQVYGHDKSQTIYYKIEGASENKVVSETELQNSLAIMAFL